MITQRFTECKLVLWLFVFLGLTAFTAACKMDPMGKQITVNEQTHAQLKARAAKERKTLSDLVEELLRFAIKNAPKSEAS